jgi:hypothetical protein
MKFVILNLREFEELWNPKFVPFVLQKSRVKSLLLMILASWKSSNKVSKRHFMQTFKYLQNKFGFSKTVGTVGLIRFLRFLLILQMCVAIFISKSMKSILTPNHFQKQPPTFLRSENLIRTFKPTMSTKKISHHSKKPLPPNFITIASTPPFKSLHQNSRVCHSNNLQPCFSHPTADQPSFPAVSLCVWILSTLSRY